MNDHDEAHLFDDLGSIDPSEQAEMNKFVHDDDVRLSSFYSLSVHFSREQDVKKCVEWLLNGPLGYEEDEITTVSRTLKIGGEPIGQYEVFVTTDVIDTFPVFAEHIAMKYIGVKSVLLKAHYNTAQEYAKYVAAEIAAETAEQDEAKKSWDYIEEGMQETERDERGDI